jgi:ethanolamine ammonia-lyase large subunit
MSLCGLDGSDPDDVDALLTAWARRMGRPGADYVVLNYQSTSFYGALYVRRLLRLQPAPEFSVEASEA